MKVDYGGTVSISTVDWYGRSATVVFLRGCPLRCPYCHNHELLDGHDIVPVEEVKRKIDVAAPLVSAVVFSGGEPLAQQEALIELLEHARDQGLSTAVQTNGYYPQRLQEVLDLVDMVSLDVKAPLDDLELYARSAGVEGIVPRVEDAIGVASGAPEYEYKTTVFDGLVYTPDHIREIAGVLPGGTYVLQQGLPENAWAEWIKDKKPVSRDTLLGLAGVAKEYIGDVRVRTKEQGEERV